MAILEDRGQERSGEEACGESLGHVIPLQRASSMEEAPSTQGVGATQSVHVSQPVSPAMPVLTQSVVHKQSRHGGQGGGGT